MARNRYLVAYDICEAGRLQAVHATMKGFGWPMQYSVFICDLSKSEKISLRLAVGELIDHTIDRIAIVDLGPLQGNGAQAFEFMGRRSLLPRTGPSIF